MVISRVCILFGWVGYIYYSVFLSWAHHPQHTLIWSTCSVLTNQDVVVLDMALNEAYNLYYHKITPLTCNIKIYLKTLKLQNACHIYFVECVSKIKHIFSQLSIIQYIVLCVFSLPISLVMIERIYTLSYYHHQIRSMNYYPLFRVRSWNNGMHSMSLYILKIWIKCFKTYTSVRPSPPYQLYKSPIKYAVKQEYMW